MAEVVAILGVPHTPLLWRLMEKETPDDLEGVAAEFERFRGILADARPDLIVMVGSDHFHQFTYVNMPAFLIGSADEIEGTWPNEERSFGLPSIRIPGHPDFAKALLGDREMPAGFDFAFSNEPVLDHSYVLPLLYLVPELNVPIVPIHTNTNAPPLPAASRFADLGRYIRAAVESYHDRVRVAVVATGHLAYELGGPSQFMGRSPDPDFDRRAVDWIQNGDLKSAVAGSRFEDLLAAGNLSFQFLNFITVAAFAGSTASSARGMPCRFGNEPFFSWVSP